MKKCFFLLIFITSQSLFSLDINSEIPLGFSMQDVKENLSNKDLYLWSIQKKYDDEKGFKSLREVSHYKSFKITQTPQNFNHIVISLKDKDYIVEPGLFCENSNKVYKKLLSTVGKDRLLCLHGVKVFDISVLVATDEKNQLIKKLQDDNKNSKYLNPIIWTKG